MVLPIHPQCAFFQRGPLLQGGDPAKTLWEYPLMRDVDKVNPTQQLVKYLYLPVF